MALSRLYEEMGNYIMRKSNIELIRLLSMMGIVLMHMMNYGNVLTFARKGTANYYIGWSLFSVGMYSIDILILISGYFMAKQHFRSWRLYKIMSQVFFYAAGIAVLFWIFSDVERTLKDTVFCLLPITSDFYWYPSMYVGMILMLPVMNRLIHTLTKRQHFCVCALCFGLFSVWPNIAFFSSTLNTAGGVSISWFMAVYIFGAYIRLYYEPDGRWQGKMLASIALMVLLPASKFFFEWMTTTPFGNNSLFEDLLWGYSVFFQYSSILVTAVSIMLFITFLNMDITSPLATRIINTAAGCSFGVYLIHDHLYVRESMWDKFAIYDMLDKWYFMPVSLILVVCIYLVCMLIELQRKRIFGLFERREGFKNIFQYIDDKLRESWNG